MMTASHVSLLGLGIPTCSASLITAADGDHAPHPPTREEAGVESSRVESQAGQGGKQLWRGLLGCLVALLRYCLLACLPACLLACFWAHGRW